MAGRGGKPLDPEEHALWRKVTADVTPLAGRGRSAAAAAPTRADPPLPPQPRKAAPEPPIVDLKAVAKKRAGPADTLDGGWDRRLRRGIAAPERTIDLHGHTLASAHAALDHAIDRALGDEVRMLLVVTGKPPRTDDAGRRRGAIRAAIGDWLAGSRHATRIAAVRNAHPRHGGTGALYVILRRRREEV